MSGLTRGLLLTALLAAGGALAQESGDAAHAEATEQRAQEEERGAHDDYEHDHAHGDEGHEHDHSDHAHGEHDHDGHDEHDHEHDHAHGDEGHDYAAGTRLVIADHEATTVSVLDLLSGEVLASFSTPGAGGAVYPSPSGQYGLVVHRDDNRITVVHSGLRLEDHGDHADLVQGAPYVLSTLNVGRQPTHVWMGDHEIAIFNDADGTVAVLDERMFGLSLEYTAVEAEQPDHGAALLLGEHLLVGHLALDRVDLYTLEGEQLESFEGCPRLHGETVLGETAAFGCADGVLLIEHREGAFTATKLDNPADTAEGARVGTLVSHENSAAVVGNLGDGLALIDPEAATLEVAPLPSAPLRFAFDNAGDHVLVLTQDGTLHTLGAQTGEVGASVEVTTPYDPDGGRPGLAVGEHAVYISAPSEGEIIEVRPAEDETALSVTRRFEVSGTPSGVGILALEGGVIH